ncbi:hypothetical protein ACWCY6_35845 [Streptomyces sp. 900105755]
MNIFRRRDEEPDDEREDGGVSPEPTARDYNSGIVNSGTMGNVQSQPHSSGSSQSMVTIASGPGTADRWTQTVKDLETALAQERTKVTDPASCEALLRLIRDQRVTEEPGRSVAGAMLNQLRAFCGDANNVLTVISTALGLLGLASG